MIISEAVFAADRSLSGVVRGYASLFGVVDGAGDMVMPGAFAATLRRRGPERVRMLFQHDHAEPIGTWTDIREDIRGLWVEGRLSIGSRRVRDIAALVADGAVAAWQDGAWTFIEPRRGWRAWIDDERTLLVHDDGEWIDVVGSTLPKFSSSTLGNAVTADPSGTWNDFDWAGWNGTHPDRATHIRLSPSAPLVLTGLSGGAPGRLAVLSNVSSGTSSNLVVVPHDSSSSFSANRVAFCDAMPRMLMPGDSLALLYDAGRSRWIELHARTFAVGFDLFSDADGPGCFASTTSGEAARSACGGDHGFSDASGAPRGLFELATGNTAGGGASWGGAEGHLSGGGGACLFLARLAVETLSAWPDRYVLRAGLHDGGLADAANGVWWEYDASTASTWRRSAGSSGTIIRNSGGLVVGTGYAWLAIFLNESWSRADFLWSLDGVWTIDGGPASGLDLAGRRLAIGVDVVKREGISSRSAYVDLMGLRYPARRG